MNSISNHFIRKVLYGVALAGMILFLCFGMSSSPVVRALDIGTQTPFDNQQTLETPTEITSPMETPTNPSQSELMNLPTETMAFSSLPDEGQTWTQSGWFSIIWGDSLEGASKTAYTLTDDNGQTTYLSLEDSLAQSLGGILSFDRKYVSVQGIWAAPLSGQNALASLYVTDISLATLPGTEILGGAPSMAVIGSKPWVSIMCKFKDITAEPHNQTFFQNMYRNTSPGMVHYWLEQSYNLVDLTGSNAAGWFTLPQPKSYYVYDMDGDSETETDFDRATADCTAAADSTVNFSTYMGIAMMFNSNLDCLKSGTCYTWGGSRRLTLDGVTKTWATDWIAQWAQSDISVIQHEMGHGFGLPHSSYDKTITYDNVWDVMSKDRYHCPPFTDTTYGCIGQHTISYHKDILGWIPSGDKFTYLGVYPQTITLEQLALPATMNYKMAQVPIGGSSTHFYTVEARRLTGYDNKLPGAAVIIHEVDTTQTIPAIIIDSDGNGDTSDGGAMWLAGETFLDVNNNISIKVDSATSTGFKVIITDGGIEDVIAKNLVLGNQGTVDVIVHPLQDGDYKVRVWDDDGISNPQWNWAWTESGIATLPVNQDHTFTFYATPTSTSESFAFWLYRKDILGLYKIIEKIIWPLNASATPPDTSPPTVTGHNNNTDPATMVYVTFSEDMQDSSFTNSTVTVYGSSSGTHAAAYSLNHSSFVLTIDPTSNFQNGEVVDVTIGTGVKDLAGNNLANPYHWNFQVDSQPSYMITGYVYVGSSGLADVWVSDGYRGDYTSSSGYYEITGVPSGWYTITPSKAGYTFNPTSSNSIHVENANKSIDPFYGTPTSGGQGIFYPVADTFISMKEQYVRYGTDPRLYIGRNSVTGGYQEDTGLIRFDVSSLAGKVVSSAKLELYFDEDGGSSLNVNAYNMLDPWAENIRYSEWNHRYSGAYDTESVSGSGWESWEGSTVMGWVQNWINTTSTNYGFYLKSTSSYYVRHGWVSKEGNQTYWPKLTVTVYNYDQPADLTVSSPQPVTVTPPFQVGQTVQWRVVSTNHGPGDAQRNDVGYYLGVSSSDYSRRLDEDTIGPVVAGASKDDNDFSYTFQEVGTWYMNVFVDDNNGNGSPGVVTETNENNNKNSYGPFTVVAANQAPSISSLPDQALNEENSLDNALDLWAYASDAETADSSLILSIDNTPTSGAGVHLDGGRYIDIIPVANWCGETDVTIRVADPQGLSNTDTFHLSVNCVNDPPWIAPSIGDQFRLINQPIVIDFTAYEHDIEDNGVNLDWYVTGLNLATISGENSDDDVLVFTPFSNVSGTDVVTLHLKDSGGLEATQNITIVFGYRIFLPFVIR